MPILVNHESPDIIGTALKIQSLDQTESFTDIEIHVKFDVRRLPVEARTVQRQALFSHLQITVQFVLADALERFESLMSVIFQDVSQHRLFDVVLGQLIQAMPRYHLENLGYQIKVKQSRRAMRIDVSYA